MDVALSAGMQDEEYLQIVRSSLDEAIQRSKPDLIIYDAGVDIAKEDKLGNLDISNAGIYRRDHYVLRACVKDFKIPVAGLIGGGYGGDTVEGMESLAYRHSLLHRAAIDVTKDFLP